MPASDGKESSQDGCSPQIMIFGSLLGMMAVAFIVTVASVPRYFGLPESVAIGKESKPIVYKGNLIAYPSFYVNGTATVNRTVKIELSIPDETKNAKAVQDIINSYPSTIDEKHTECGIAFPKMNKPCFFSRNWLEQDCESTTMYGYKEIDELFNPCVLFRLENTGAWIPQKPNRQTLPNSIMDKYEESYLGIYCYPRVGTAIDRNYRISYYPEKGFYRWYFPVDDFVPETYLYPAVVVRFAGIPKGSLVTFKCALLSRNSYQLWNGGMVELQFDSR